jgi:hypothetical protein
VWDARLTAQVNRDASLAVAGVRNQLQHDVTSATAVLQQLQAASAAATRTRNGLLRDVISWLALLFTARWPTSLYEFTGGYLRYITRV